MTDNEHEILKYLILWGSPDLVRKRLYLWNDMAEVGIDESPREFPSDTVRPGDLETIVRFGDTKPQGGFSAVIIANACFHNHDFTDLGLLST